MGRFAKLAAGAAHPALIVFLRGVLENDFREIRARIFRDLVIGKRARTLDLACGPGVYSDLFGGDDYVGVDVNRRYIDHARRHRKGAFIVGDARSVDLPDARFNQVLVVGLLHHLPDADVRAVLRECRRLLVSGGRALIIEDMRPRSRLNLVSRILQGLENAGHIRRPEDYRRLYADAAQVERDEVFRSGVRDYYGALLRV